MHLITKGRKILNVDTVCGIFNLIFFSGSPCTGQTWSFSALISHLLVFLTPVVESKLSVVLEACYASPVCVCVLHVSVCTYPCTHT